MFVFFQAEDGIRYLVRSRGLGDVYKRQDQASMRNRRTCRPDAKGAAQVEDTTSARVPMRGTGCLLYTSDAADERSSVDLGGRRIIKKKK